MTYGVYLLYRPFEEDSTKSYGEEKTNRNSTNNMVNDPKCGSSTHLVKDELTGIPIEASTQSAQTIRRGRE
jgi:hypothetical protein